MEITSLAGGENPGGMADEHPPQDDYDGHAEDDDGGGLPEKHPLCQIQDYEQDKHRRPGSPTHVGWGTL